MMRRPGHHDSGTKCPALASMMSCANRVGGSRRLRDHAFPAYSSGLSTNFTLQPLLQK